MKTNKNYLLKLRVHTFCQLIAIIVVKYKKIQNIMAYCITFLKGGGAVHILDNIYCVNFVLGLSSRSHVLFYILCM